MSTPQQDKAAQLIFAPNAQQNASTLLNIHYLTACFAGAVAGVLGLENWKGFGLFIITSLLSSGLVAAVKCKGTPEKFVNGGLLQVFNPGTDNIFSFVLVWTLFYGIVHVYD